MRRLEPFEAAVRDMETRLQETEQSRWTMLRNAVDLFKKGNGWKPWMGLYWYYCPGNLTYLLKMDEHGPCLVDLVITNGDVQ